MRILKMKLNDSKYLTFDDVLIVPKFSSIRSRKDVDVSSMDLRLPIISSNMDTITSTEMAIAMGKAGGMGVLHRFWSVQENVDAFVKANIAAPNVSVSIGITDGEKERAEALIDAGAKIVFIDVAHGAQIAVVDQVRFLREKYKMNIEIVAGNFATAESIRHFCLELNDADLFPDAFKVGIGPGSVCTTRIKTGIGIPQLYAIMSCVQTGLPIIADGGMRTSGDIIKSLAAGAKAAMLGGMLAGTIETPGEVIYPEGEKVCPVKVYRGSASKESYADQNKVSDWRAAEGIYTTVPLRGSVNEVLQDIEGSLRSSFSYVGAKNITEFQDKATFIEVSNSSQKENGPHAVRS
jgi:IMP dehydrogenase